MTMKDLRCMRGMRRKLDTLSNLFVIALRRA